MIFRSSVKCQNHDGTKLVFHYHHITCAWSPSHCQIRIENTERVRHHWSSRSITRSLLDQGTVQSMEDIIGHLGLSTLSEYSWLSPFKFLLLFLYVSSGFLAFLRFGPLRQMRQKSSQTVCLDALLISVQPGISICTVNLISMIFRVCISQPEDREQKRILLNLCQFGNVKLRKCLQDYLDFSMEK